MNIKSTDIVFESKKHRIPYIARLLISLFILILINVNNLHYLQVPAVIHMVWSFIWIIIIESRYSILLKKPWTKYLRDTLDILEFTILIYITGTSQSIFIVSFPIWVIGSSLYEKKTYGLYMAFTSATSYAVLLSVIYTGIIPYVNVFSRAPVLPDIYFGIFSVVFLYTINYFVHDFINKLYVELLTKSREKKDVLASYIASENKYRSILENINEGYFELDLKGSFTFFNDAICTILDRSKEDVLGLNYRAFMPEEDAKRAYETHNRVYRTGEMGSLLDWRVVRKDGSTRYLESSIDVRKNGSGTIIGFRGMARDVTEKKLAEEALINSEERLRHFIENASDFIYINDEKGRMTFFNEATITFLGYSENEFYNRRFLDFIPDEYKADTVAFYRNQMKNSIGETYYEHPIKKKNGEIAWVGEMVKLLKKNDTLEFYCIGRDITEKKKAEEALRQSEEKYRTILDNISEGYYEVDLKGNVTFYNESLSRLVGHKEENLKGKNFSVFMTQDPDKIYQIFNEVYKTGRPSGIFEYDLVTENGREITAEATATLITDQFGNKTGFRGILRDITEKKRSEEALRESEERYRHIIENANDIICQIDHRGRFIFMSPRGLKELGYSMKELLQMAYIDLVDSKHKEEVLDFYINQVKEGIPDTYYEMPIVRKNGELLWIGQNVRLSKDMNGKIGFYSIARDITERIRAEEARNELELQKNRFFANISHEIRTPLTMILSPIESVLQGEYKKAVDDHFFNNLYRNGLKLLKLINNLLDFSKIEAGRMLMKVQEADIVRFIRNYVGAVHSAAESKNITVQIHTDSNMIDNLYFDQEKMDKIIMNLISNSLKFTEQNGSIDIRVHDDDIYCYIEFEDNGRGIPSDRIAVVFDRFSQADSSSTRKFEGTGIGLSLVKEFVKMHGGTITVESRYIEENPDRHGTTFLITLLKGTEHYEAMDNVEFVTETEVQDSVTDYRYLGMREMKDLDLNSQKHSSDIEMNISAESRFSILVVEDNADMRDFLTMLLLEKYYVYTAVNGKEGLQMARERNPDLIITDVMMPVMNGYDMTKGLKSDDKLKIIPVLMITAKAELVHKIEGFDYGADDYLTKPFNSKELLARVHSLLRSHEYEKIILQRNQVIENELEIARLLQQKLLPGEMIDIHGYRSHSVYIPMDKVGGDFYDFRFENNTLELYLADVSGHGLPGAFLSMLTKMALESIENRDSTMEVLKQLNDVIYRSTVKNNFITSFYCIIDIDTNTMKYCNAGHIPPLLLQGERNDFIELQTKGKPLGWFKDLELEEKTVQLVPGDKLILYTDGITECTDEQYRFFGEDRLCEVIMEKRTEDPEAISEHLLNSLISFSGTDSFDDDLTLLIFEVLEK